MFMPQMFAGSGTLVSPGAGGWFGSVFGGGQTDAGVTINPQTALAMTAVQRSVTLLAESIAQLPCYLYQATGDDSRQKVTNHAVSRIIGAEPNGWMTPFQMTEYKQVSLGLRGNSYGLKDFDEKGNLKGIFPIHPDRVQVLISPVDRMPYYRILLGQDGIEGTFPLRMIHHIRWVSDNPYVGLSPITLHKEALGIVAAGERHTAKVFANGTRLSGFLTRPAEAQGIKDQARIDRIVDDWERKYSGSSNTGRVGFLQEGMEFKPLSMSNEDAQLIESRNYGVRDIARIYGIPPHKLGDLSQATNNNIENQSMEFVIYTLMPWIRRHEEAMERDLLVSSERLEKGFYIQFDVSGLLRGDQSSRFASYAQARQWGWLSVNDIRRLENLPPIQGGNTYLTPLNMADGKTGLPITGVPKPSVAAEVTEAQIREIERVCT